MRRQSARNVVASARLALVLVMAVATPTYSATPAPSNDLRANATVATSLPFSQVLDTTGATSDADDAVAQARCPFSPGFFFGNSVWYSYTATADTSLVVDTNGTDYPVFAIIFAGPVENSALTCAANLGAGGDVVRQNIARGTQATVYIASISESPGFQHGGNLSVTIAGTPPPNDKIADAKTIPSLPYNDEIFTYGATSDAADSQVDTCGIGTQASVWYKFTAGPNDTSMFVYSDTGAPSGSLHYNFGFAVATGSPGTLNTIACSGNGFVDVATTPGSTYYIMASGGGTPYGGRLRLNVVHSPPPPTISVDFDGRGYVDGIGAHLTGTYECANVVLGFAFASAGATQKEGPSMPVPVRAPVSLADFNCDGQRRSFQGTAYSGGRGSQFLPGSVSVDYFPQVCDIRGCAFFGSKSRKIVLTPKP